LYDIVSWILSVVGNVPDMATRGNYYYPLLMVAYVFCKKLVPDIPFQTPYGTIKMRGAPEVWMVMWFKQTVENRLVTRVVLGATLDNPVNYIKDVTKGFRKNLMIRAGMIAVGEVAPMQQYGRQEFGHCAETYPLGFFWA
jgi:hypothetical protein